MTETVNAQTAAGREIINTLDRQFARLHSESRSLIEQTPLNILYTPALPEAPPLLRSIGESVLRSAAAVEQTFGGITANLWDDPFEWTLPEHLSTPAKVLAHLDEVERTRARAFSSFADDECLQKQIGSPALTSTTLYTLLIETLLRANAFAAQAAISFRILSRTSPAGFII
jgi:hypothetical protein